MPLSPCGGIWSPTGRFFSRLTSFRACQLSYNDGTFKVNGPWMRMFQNAYRFAVGEA